MGTYILKFKCQVCNSRKMTYLFSCQKNACVSSPELRAMNLHFQDYLVIIFFFEKKSIYRQKYMLRIMFQFLKKNPQNSNFNIANIKVGQIFIKTCLNL